MKQTVRFEPNEFGGRLIYSRAGQTDERFWDALWEGLSADQTDRPNKLPWQLRGPFSGRVKVGGRVLEAGCGLARFTVALHAGGYAAEGLDYAPTLVTRLSRRFPEIPFHLGDVRHLPEIADQSYDAIYLPGVCEHFESGPGQVLQEMHRILKKDGHLFCSAPCFNRLRRFAARMGAYRPAGAAGGEFYQYAFTEAELSRILESLGFCVEEVKSYGSFKALQDLFPGLLGRVPKFLIKPLAVMLDLLPVTRSWGHSCIWIARRI